MRKNPSEFLDLIAQTIFDKKGFNILALDVRGSSSITDYIVIAEGNVDRHVTAIAKAIVEAMNKQGENPIYVEGLQNGDWVVIDFFDLMIHIFMPGLRDRYKLEKLWAEGKRIDLTIDVSSPLENQTL